MYRNADDETRVKLPVSDNAAADEDYINANYIVVRRTLNLLANLYF